MATLLYTTAPQSLDGSLTVCLNPLVARMRASSKKVRLVEVPNEAAEAQQQTYRAAHWVALDETEYEQELSKTHSGLVVRVR